MSPSPVASRPPRARSAGFACSSCGHATRQWFGRCPDCSEWNSAVEQGGDRSSELLITSLGDGGEALTRIPAGVIEVDRVLGGGLVAGEVVLLAGEPGIGKSTLVLQLLNGLGGAGRTSLLVTGEESASQVALRAKRLGVSVDRIQVAASISLPAVLAACSRTRPDVLMIDSIQTLEDPSLDQASGSPVQVRSCAARLVQHAKTTGTVVVLVGHVTKEGAVAGPKTLEHVVDAVVTLEGERTGSLRILRAVKNRFGSCDESGVFMMTAGGLEAVADPSAMLLADRREGVAGSVVFPGIEGSRPVLVELQALVTAHSTIPPRRVALGVDARRLTLLLAVLGERADSCFGERDVFVSAAGGLAVKEPASDLAMCLALASAARGVPVAPTTVAIGEVGLGGEVRRVPAIERRLAEAARLGFTRAVVPRSAKQQKVGMELVEVADLPSALRAARG